MSGDPSVGEDVVMNDIVELTEKVNLIEPTIVDEVEVIVEKKEMTNEIEKHSIINQSDELHAAEVTVSKSCPVHKESEKIAGIAEINFVNGSRVHIFDKNLPDEYSQKIQLSDAPETIALGLKFEKQEIINCPGQETSTFPQSISEDKPTEAISHEQVLHGNNEEVIAYSQSSIASPVAVEDTRSFSSPSSQSQGDPSSNNLPHHPTYHSRGEMFIPSDRVGVVIGARGANINEVMRRTGCRIQIQQENLVDDRERLVVFDGSPSQIRDARLLINGLSVDGPSVLESGGAGGVSSSHSSDRGDRDDRERGRRGGGSNLGNNGNYNNSNSNHINNSHSGGNHNGGGAHHHIGNSAGQQQQQFSTYNGEPPALEEDIDPQMVRVVIGVKGITVTSIARKSGARILMNQRFPVGHPHKIQYWGSQAQIEVARHLVTTLLNYGPEALQQEINGHGSSAGGERSDSGRSDRHGDSRGDRGDRDNRGDRAENNRGDRAENNRGERNGESTVTLQDVKVFQSQMVRLLGPHGNNVNEVQGRYGVKISIDTTPQLAPVNNLGPSGFPEATNKVTVSGPAGAVQLAVKQLHELIDVHGEAPQPPPQQNQPTPQHGQQQPPQQQQQSVSANSGASGGYPSHGGSARNQPPQQHNQHHGGQQGHSGNSYGSGFAITPVIHQSPQPRPSAPLGFNPTMTNPGAAQQAHPGQMPLVQQRVMPPQQQVAGFAQQQQHFQQPQMVAAMNSAGFMGMPSPTQQPLVMGGVMPMQQPQQMHGQNQQQQQQPQQLQQQGQFAPQQFANPQQQMLAAQQAQQRPPEGAQQLPDGTYQQIAEISNAVVGRLQGRNNVTLGLIRNKSGALVQLGASDMVRGVTRIVLIGSPQTVALASQMVQEVLVNGAGKLHQLLDVPGSAMQPATANTPEMVPPGMVVQQTPGGMPMMMQQPSLVPMGAQQQFLSGPQMVPHFAASQQQQLQPPQQPGGGMLVMQPNGMVFPMPNSNVPGMQQQQQQLAHQQVAQQQQQQLAQHSQQMHFPQQPNMPQQFPPQMPPQQQHLAQPGLQQMQFAAGLQQQQHALQGVQGANGMPGAMFMASQLHQQPGVPMGGPAAGMPVPAMGFVNGQPHQHLQQQHQQSFALQQQHQQTMQFAQHQQQHDRIQQQYGPGQGAYPHMQQAQSPHHQQQQQRLQQQQQQQQRAPPGNNNFNNNRRY